MIARSTALLLGLCCSLSAAAVTIGDTHFADSVRLEQQRLPLRGAGKFVWKLTFDVYAVALYLPAEVPADQVFDDVPKRLVFHYCRDFKKDDFPKGAEALLKRNLTAAERRSIAAEIEQINRLYVDIRAGDRYALTYIPGQGTQLAKNDRVLGTVPGAGFARLYLRIWLGEQPFSEKLRDKLLGR